MFGTIPFSKIKRLHILRHDSFYGIHNESSTAEEGVSLFRACRKRKYVRYRGYKELRSAPGLPIDPSIFIVELVLSLIFFQGVHEQNCSGIAASTQLWAAGMIQSPLSCLIYIRPAHGIYQRTMEKRSSLVLSRSEVCLA
jgi:hypothetical protein